MRVLWVCLAALCLALPVAAQEGPRFPTAAPQFVVVDVDQLFADSAYARSLREAVEEEARSLSEENARIIADLTAEERSLTERRAEMTPEAFRAEAAAFDAKVQDIRRARDAKEAELQQARAEVRTTFFDQARPVVGQLMIERGAVAVLDSRSVFVTVRSADITTAAVARIDSALMAGADDAN